MAKNRIIGGVVGLFGDIGRAHSASALYSDLSTLSDAGLKARGLNRDDLARYAFDKAFGK